MSGFSLRPRDRRALMVGAVVLAFGFAFRFGVLPHTRGVAALNEAIALERGLLERELAVVEAARRANGRVDTLQARLAERAPLLLPAADEMAAAGALSGYVAEAAEDAGLRLQRAEGQGSRDLGSGVTSTDLLVHAIGDLEGVLRFLHALEEGPRLVRVERLSIRPSAIRRADPGEARALEVSGLVSGFRIEPRDPPPEPSGAEP